jgi:hypothetical protein
LWIIEVFGFEVALLIGHSERGMREWGRQTKSLNMGLDLKLRRRKTETMKSHFHLAFCLHWTSNWSTQPN